MYLWMKCVHTKHAIVDGVTPIDDTQKRHINQEHVIKCDKIKQNLIIEIEKSIDTKVFQWMKQKQTIFRVDEKDKIEQFNCELIQYLNTLRDTSKFPTNFREHIESQYIGYKITSILKSMVTS